MPPTSDGDIRTIGCVVAKLIPDAGHLDRIRQALRATQITADRRASARLGVQDRYGIGVNEAIEIETTTRDRMPL